MISACGLQFTLELTTSQGRLTATIAQVGASLRSLRLNDTEFVLSCEPEDVAPYCAGIVMAPWVNRLADGKWTYRGREMRVPITIHDQQNANHGLLEFAEYRLVSQTASESRAEVCLAATIHPRAGYPFLVETTVTYALTEEGLVVTHEARNLSADPAPYAVGGHPYFQVAGHPTEDLMLSLPAASVIEVNERQIPIGRAPVAGSRFDLRQPKRVGDNFFDHNFGDLERDSDGRARSYLRASDGKFISVWQDAAFKYIVLFTPDFYPTRNGNVWAVAIEPQTSAANSFNTGEDLLWLEQGRRFAATWGVELHAGDTETQ